MVRKGTPSDRDRETEQQHRDIERRKPGAERRGRPSTAPPPRSVDRTAENDEHPPEH